MELRVAALTSAVARNVSRTLGEISDRVGFGGGCKSESKSENERGQGS